MHYGIMKHFVITIPIKNLDCYVNMDLLMHTQTNKGYKFVFLVVTTWSNTVQHGVCNIFKIKKRNMLFLILVNILKFNTNSLYIANSLYKNIQYFIASKKKDLFH